jgi:hypothetical protein
MHPTLLIVAGGLLCFAMSVAASEPWYTIDAAILGAQNQRIRCSPREKLVLKPMRLLLRKLLVGMASLQLCRDHASSTLCTMTPSKFQRHHHCRLLSLLQRSAQTCRHELQCKQQTTSFTGCSLVWQSNIAAMQWLFPRHVYCSNPQVEKVPTTYSDCLLQFA